MTPLIKRSLLFSFLFLSPLFSLFAGDAMATCQEVGGVNWHAVPCTKDSECTGKRVVGGVTVECTTGAVCRANDCQAPFGNPGISNNKIAGGYSLTGAGLGLLINNVVLAIGAISGLIFFAMLIMGGIAYMSSQGDEKQVMHAKNQITAGLVGLLIVFMSWWVVKIISVVFGFNLLMPVFSGP